MPTTPISSVPVDTAPISDASQYGTGDSMTMESPQARPAPKYHEANKGLGSVEEGKGQPDPSQGPMSRNDARCYR